MTREEAAENGKEFAIAANCHQRQETWQPEKVIFFVFILFGFMVSLQIGYFCVNLELKVCAVLHFRLTSNRLENKETLHIVNFLFATGTPDFCDKVEQCLRTRTAEEIFEAYDKGTFRFLEKIIKRGP